MFWGINCTCPKIVLSFRQKLELCKANSPSWIQPDKKKLCISITNAKTIWRIVHNGRGKHGGLALSQSWPSVVLLCPVSRFFYIFTNGCRGGPVTKSDQSDIQLIWVEGSPWGQHCIGQLGDEACPGCGALHWPGRGNIPDMLRLAVFYTFLQMAAVGDLSPTQINRMSNWFWLSADIEGTRGVTLGDLWHRVAREDNVWMFTWVTCVNCVMSDVS